MPGARTPSPAPDQEPQADTPAPVAVAKPRRAYLPAPERRRRIIAAAQEVFAKSNLQGARTRDIASAAEINQATLFEHFESKEALFHAAVVEPLLEAMRGMHDRAQTYEAAGSVEEMRTLAQASAQRHLDVMVDIFPLFTAAMFSDLELGKKLYREQIVPILKERSEAIQGIVKDKLDPELAELAMFGAFFAVAMDRTFNGKTKELPNLAEQLTILATAGFAKDFKKA